MRFAAAEFPPIPNVPSVESGTLGRSLNGNPSESLEQFFGGSPCRINMEPTTPPTSHFLERPPFLNLDRLFWVPSVNWWSNALVSLLSVHWFAWQKAGRSLLFSFRGIYGKDTQATFTCGLLWFRSGTKPPHSQPGSSKGLSLERMSKHEIQGLGPLTCGKGFLCVDQLPDYFESLDLCESSQCFEPRHHLALTGHFGRANTHMM